jgi:hypothetical protein
MCYRISLRAGERGMHAKASGFGIPQRWRSWSRLEKAVEVKSWALNH